VSSPSAGDQVGGERGQALLIVLGGLAVLLIGAVVLAGIASGLTGRGDQQRAADLAALSAARTMAAAYPRLFVPVAVAGQSNPERLSSEAYRARAVRAARATARENGVRSLEVGFPDADAEAPLRVRVVVQDDLDAADGLVAGVRAEAAVIAGSGGSAVPGAPGRGEYPGPYATRQGKPMRPDTAAAFDRMAAAASKDGYVLSVTSGYRSDAEQARLFAAHPDPKWVAPPGTSLHRLGTELDLGPPAAYPWLLGNSGRFHFTRRYPWEPWHFGYTLNAGTSSLGYTADGRTALPSFVPTAFQPAIARAAQRWNVSGALLSAQIYAESGFNPFARSEVGAQGIAQFMPATALSYGLKNPFDPDASIDAQAHLMRDLLRQFGQVPLALAAYNAGPGNVAPCGCVPPFPETQAYVARILALLSGAGLDGGSGGELEVQLVD
jgi:hypothetical protein